MYSVKIYIGVGFNSALLVVHYCLFMRHLMIQIKMHWTWN